MSKTWKWILGIILGLVILAGVGFTVATFMGNGRMPMGESQYYGHPMMDNHNFSRRLPMDDYRDFRHPMVGNYGFVALPFLFFGGLLRLLFPLAVIGVVAYFSYKKGKKDGMAAATAVPAPEPIEEE